MDSIAPPPKDDPDQKCRTKVYQSIVGCINWLATCTRPDIAPCLTFLASYNNCPSHEHYKSALYALKYLYSTADYDISYHSVTTSPASPVFLTPVGVANLATPFLMVLPSSYSNITASPVMSSAKQGDQSAGNPSGKIVPLSAM
jgi:hypothetical protein